MSRFTRALNSGQEEDNKTPGFRAFILGFGKRAPSSLGFAKDIPLSNTPEFVRATGVEGPWVPKHREILTLVGRGFGLCGHKV